jgi:hypothetical protein
LAWQTGRQEDQFDVADTKILTILFAGKLI